MSGRRPSIHLLCVGLVAALLGSTCSKPGDGGAERTVVFWGMGREGEVVRDLVPEFERLNPGLRVSVQQIPWTSAHEKLLTAFVGGSAPDIAQVGNTWIPEFAAIGALEPLDAPSAESKTLTPRSYFPGVWETSIYAGHLYGIPWYVDTRVLFYRSDLLARAGYREPPRTWETWRDSMRRVRALQGPAAHPLLLPTDEWAQPVIFGAERGSPLLDQDETRGAFSQPAFAGAADFYVSLFREGLAPITSNTQVGNPYQEFERGNLAMWITGPWNLGEFRRRLSPDAQNRWMTAPLPAPDAGSPWPGVSLAGGSSFAVFHSSPRKKEAWKLIEFLSRPEIQARFYSLSGNLPARTEAWKDPLFASDTRIRAFREQLERLTPMPRVPEWEQIAQQLAERLEPAIRGRETVAQALASLDADVDRILEKRRWILERERAGRGR